MVQKHPEISVVLMDVKMPVMSGYEATAAIKKLRPDLPVIAQTAYALSGDKDKALAAGCDDYLSKPIKREALLRKLNLYLNRDRKSTRLNSSHVRISYAVFCLKK